MSKKSKCTDKVENKHKEKNSQEQECTNVEAPESSDVSKCEQERDNFKAQFLRVTADFENFKRRQEKEQAQWYQQAQADVLKDLLVIVDNFDRALQEKQARTPELASWLQGFELIHKFIKKLLKDYEVEELKNMSEFDPEFHEALAQVEAEDKTPGEIVDVLEKGYTFKGSLLRPAKVTVVKD